MLGLPKTIFRELCRALDAAQHELRLLEQDLGLCADCGDRPPAPLRERPVKTVPVRAPVPAERRRVA
jgi:hypothetical protein